MSFPIWRLVLIGTLLYDYWDKRCCAKVCVTSHPLRASLQAHLKEDELQDSNCTGDQQSESHYGRHMKGKHDYFRRVSSNVILSSRKLWLLVLVYCLNKPMLHKKSSCLESSADSTCLMTKEAHKVQHSGKSSTSNVTMLAAASVDVLAVSCLTPEALLTLSSVGCACLEARRAE